VRKGYYGGREKTNQQVNKIIDSTTDSKGGTKAEGKRKKLLISLIRERCKPGRGLHQNIRHLKKRRQRGSNIRGNRQGVSGFRKTGTPPRYKQKMQAALRC